MSQGQFCTCGRDLRTDKEDLIVLALKCNHSAFNGYRRTPSNWSEVRCIRPGCHGIWRTKSDYVYQLPDCTGNPDLASELEIAALARAVL